MNERKPYIEFEHVHKAFGDKVVIDNVSFDVMSGETVCILGRSGVGKSVSLQMIMGFLKADGGTIRVSYEDVTSYTEEQMERIRKKVTMVFQTARFSTRSRSAKTSRFRCASAAASRKSRFIRSSTASSTWSECVNSVTSCPQISPRE